MQRTVGKIKSKAWDGVLLRGNLLRIAGKDFRLRPVERRVLARLIDGEGRIVPHAALVDAASPGVSDRGYESGTRAHLITTLSEIRKFGVRIENVKGRGYRLVPAGGDPVSNALSEAKIALARLERLLNAGKEGMS